MGGVSRGRLRGATGAFERRLEGSRAFEMLSVAWETVRISGRVGKVMVTRPFNWFGDTIYESNANFQRCLVPLIISQAIWIIGFGVLNFGEVAVLLGVSDRDPPGVYIGYVREVATWITMMILAGVAGSALAADLGSRKIREELDALSVLGVDQVRKLIVPRVLAMIFSAIVLALLGLLIAIASNFILFPIVAEQSREVYAASWQLGITPLDLYGSIVKHAFLGLFIGLVACQKGLSVKGGAEGVGRAVNETVVITFFGIWLVNSLYNVAFLTLFPELSVQRG